MENKRIVELAKNCKLVRRGSEENGHDCWGNYEWTSYKYVIIEGKEQKIWDDYYIVHNGKKVEKVMSKFLYELELKEAAHFEKTGFKTPAEYRAYLKGKSESNK